MEWSDWLFLDIDKESVNDVNILIYGMEID
jgi:hypothetical protein